MALNVANKLFELSDKELVSYVRDRLIDLEIFSDDSNHVLPVIQRGFISKNTEIKTSDYDELGYSMEGIDYLEFVNYLRSNVTDMSEISLIVYTAHYVTRYFDFDIKAERVDIRDKIIINSAIEGSGINDVEKIRQKRYLPSINCLKNVGQAVCLEHSVLMQNLLSFLDIDVGCFLMIALVNNVIKGHAVNIIDVNLGGEIKHLYYDLISMEATMNGDVEVASPTLRIINDEDYNNFIKGVKPLAITRQCSSKKGGVETTLYLPISLKNMEEMEIILKKR